MFSTSLIDARIAIAAVITSLSFSGAVATAGAQEPTAETSDRCELEMIGTDSADSLDGAETGDSLEGLGDADVLKGAAGEDCLDGGAGHDKLVGGPDRDKLDGGKGRDTLRGGGGRDRLVARDGVRDVVRCGPGRDVAIVDAKDRVSRCERVKKASAKRGGNRKPKPDNDTGSGDTGSGDTGSGDTGSGDTGSPSGYVPESHLGAVPADAYYLAPSGSDSNPGTRQAPWRTLDHAQGETVPGDTVVLLPGDYGAHGETTVMSDEGTASDPITYRGEPGSAMPRIKGFFKITRSYQRFNYLLFDGPTGPVKTASADNPNGEQVQVSIYGDAVNGVEISDSEIRESGWHAGLYLSTANDVRITGNYIHNNGDVNDPGQANKSHGIYFSSGSGLIANNVIENNVARGVQLYTDPVNVTVANNTIVHNGKAGIQFGAETSSSRAVNNVVAYNGEYGIRGASLTGAGNEIAKNLVWGNPKGNLAFTDGLSLTGNIQQSPGFGSSSSDYRPPATSPVVDTGASAHAPGIDFDGADRGSAPDLGAFEVG